MRNLTLVPIEKVESKIYLIRSKKVMMDTDLAELYKVEVRTLIQSVKRNLDRFPEDFMFQLSKEEEESLRSQFVISKRGGRRYRSTKQLSSAEAGPLRRKLSCETILVR